MICIITYVIGCLFKLYIYMLFYCRQSNSHGLLAAIVCVIIGLRTHFRLWTCLPRITHILFSWTVSIVLPNHTQFILVNHMLYIAHTFIWLPISFVLPNHKQFIRVNRMMCIAHAFIWLPVSFVLPHRKQLIELSRMPSIAHATKIWTVFDASSIANVLHLFWRFLHPHLWLMHHTQFRERVSDRSVALAATCSSVCVSKTLIILWLYDVL